jgi:hypothetical protein
MYGVKFLTAGICLLIFAGCTESPFQEKVDEPKGAQIFGQISLDDLISPDGAYVWLEGVNASARTDQDGKFELTLPPSSQGGVNGVFSLYIYLSNYKFATVQTVVQDGKFLYAQGDITARGEVNGKLSIRKILDISTSVTPSTVPKNYTGPIFVAATLHAVLDSVDVVFPKMVGGLLGAVLFKKIETGEVFVDIPDLGARTRFRDKVGNEPRAWVQTVFLTRGGITSSGVYEVIPYFFIEQMDLPPELISSLGVDVNEVENVEAEFAGIPAKRAGGRLIVTE